MQAGVSGASGAAAQDEELLSLTKAQHYQANDTIIEIRDDEDNTVA